MRIPRELRELVEDVTRDWMLLPSFVLCMIVVAALVITLVSAASG